jgi:hypothetical protein
VISMKKDLNEELNDLVASIQFDQWILVLGAPRCTVVSHLDEDHDPTKCAFYATPLVINSHAPTKGLTLKVDPDTCELHGGLCFWLLDKLRVDAQRPYVRCTKFHAEWWYICSKKVGLLFIGDLDYPEIAVIQTIVDYIRSRRPLNAVLLPSYGGINHPYHKVPEGGRPTLMADSIASVVRSLKKLGIKVGGLPHPIEADWSDFPFTRLTRNS